MKLKVTLALLVIASSVFAQRQLDDDSWTIQNRAYAGVGFAGLNFGQDGYYGRYFSIGGSVLGGYMLTNNLSAGVGFDYQYTRYGDIGLTNHLFGGYPFVRYNIADFFAQADYAVYSLKADIGTENEARVQAERFFLGVGYSPPSVGRAQFNVLLSYDLMYENLGLFASPISLRAFITFH